MVFSGALPEYPLCASTYISLFHLFYNESKETSDAVALGKKRPRHFRVDNIRQDIFVLLDKGGYFLARLFQQGMEMVCRSISDDLPLHIREKLRRDRRRRLTIPTFHIVFELLRFDRIALTCDYI